MLEDNMLLHLGTIFTSILDMPPQLLIHIRLKIREKLVLEYTLMLRNGTVTVVLKV